MLNISKLSSCFCLMNRRLYYSALSLRAKITMETATPAFKVRLSDKLSPLVKPVNYNLRLNPNMNDGTFQGTVNINVHVQEDKKYLHLHSKFLDISDVKVSKDNEDISVSKYVEVKHIEQLLIYFENILEAGHYHIKIDFNGSLTRNIVGFYASKLKDRTMVASKFEPTYARQAFPCFDEPEFKASFDIALVKPSGYKALSNMNEISLVREDSSNMDVVFFATSVPMSTYLACFVICDFDFKETEINTNGIGKNFTLRSFAQKGETYKIDFAQSIGKRATEYYIQYYEVPFPLPKLDMIAIPDYQSGATEHWGLITYRETSFLIDEATASVSNKIAVANTIAHELAHMWFGNLVTMKWWDELWLNEGFASYMQVKSLNAIEPTWTMLDQFLTRTLHSVLVTDAKLSSHAIVQTVTTPDEITAIFDSISYNKGASVLRMLEGFVGEENFRRGVSDYLKKYEFGNTITENFLSSLEPHFKNENANLSLRYIMDTWTRQMGYPVLTVAPSDQPHTYVVTQSRFLLDPNAKYTNDSQFNYRWCIPITYKTNQGPVSNILWFSDKAQNVTISIPEDSWLKINNNQVGFYRVNYTADMWKRLIDELKSNTKMLTLSDRSHLQNDIFALAEARLVSYSQALELTTYLTAEEDFVPWQTAASIFSALERRLRTSNSFEHFQKFRQHLVEPLYQKQSWDKTNTTVIEGLLRVRILSLAIACGVPDAQSKVRTLFLKWLNAHGTPNAADIEPDLRDLVYFHGMKSATKEEWEKLWQIYLNEKDAHEQLKLRRALTAPDSTVILRRFLNLAWDEKNVRGQDYLNVLHYISENPSGVALIWDDVRNRWPVLVERFTLNSRYLGNLIPGITSDFDTDLKLKEMDAFFSEYPEAGAGETARRRAIENVKNNIIWRQHNEPTIAAWLKSYVDGLN